MSFNPLSDIPASELIEELGTNPLFAALSAQQKLEYLNSAVQEVNNLYVAKGKPDYLGDTLTATLPVYITYGATGFYTGYINPVAVGPGGSTVVFSQAFTTVTNPEGDYILFFVCKKNGADVGATVVRSATQVTFVPPESGCSLEYFVAGYTV